ncbi:transcriptional regulator, TetR family [[Leptolyngbya] sp. PCC 7376]|uniref:TetR/AcrR family transcriptional regulator n=1 Tax=[Leptolyngbya] sp. PCC 7376 TaxID=111781 RepID=UPI00029F479C|nr:TetR/AcrR family transcriptional regulator [[Leptolyngbya] sp. PCC 7376]AFY38542.1 transcriptional regulator, TetR family [[Leptolyngbya] sp. PCC 7376]
MSKSQETRENIIRKAAPIFNRQGFVGTSMSDIMKATGLKKGGIYNHFKNKDELAIAAFDFYIGLIRERYGEVLKRERHAIPRLQLIVTTFCEALNAEDSPIQGGCPLLNTAIDSDDTHPVLRERSREAMDTWRQLFVKIINFGIRHKEIKESVDPEVTSTIIISNLEGALMMSKLYDDRQHLCQIKDHLFQFFEGLKV